MPHNQKSMRKLLIEHGWTQTRGGKHAVKMTEAGRRPSALSMHKRREYSKGLEAAILRHAGLL
jgi:hypothetical protein